MRKPVLVVGVASLVMLAIADTALSGHARPNAPSPVTFKLAPAFNACTTGSNGAHGLPLALPSCNPPVQTSEYLTWNAPDRPAPFNTPAKGSGFVTLKPTCVSSINPPVENGDTPPCPANLGDQADVTVTLAISDLRCTGAPPFGGQANCAGAGGGAAASLYSGKVLTTQTFRITDHENGREPNPPGADCSDSQSCDGTVVDFPFSTGAQCTNGACNYATSFEAVIPDLIKEGKRTVVGLGQLQVEDAGLDGNLVGGPPPQTGICPPSCVQIDESAVAFTQGLAVP